VEEPPSPHRFHLALAGPRAAYSSNAAIGAAALSGSSGDDALHQLRAMCGRLTSAVGRFCCKSRLLAMDRSPISLRTTGF